MVPVFKNVWEMSVAKSYHHFSLLSVVSKVFEKIVDNRLVDHHEKWDLFPDFLYGFKSSQTTADLQTAASDRTAGGSATRAVAMDTFKAFNRVWYAGPLQNLKSYGISISVFGFILSFLSNRQLWVVLIGKSSQGYPVNAGFPQGSISGPTFFLLHINDFSNDVICNVAIYADDTTLYAMRYVWSSIWFVATTRVGFWIWIWTTRHCRLEYKIAYWFQCWKNSACFFQPDY